MSKDHLQTGEPSHILRRIAEGTLGEEQSQESRRWRALLEIAKRDGVTSQMIYSTLRDGGSERVSVDPRSVYERVAEVIDGAERAGLAREYVIEQFEKLQEEAGWLANQTGSTTGVSSAVEDAATILHDIIFPDYFQEPSQISSTS